METVVERPGALDVHKAQVTACVRVPADSGGREQHVAEFSTTVAGLLTLRDWLTAHGVTQVTMEATGVFWKPIWAILEDEFELLLVNARHVKQVPGRKTDVKDAEWLCQLAEAGLLKASFVPPKPIRALRNLTRYRKTQIQERSREANRLHKALEDTGIKLDCVASDILGVSGRLMLDALVAGTTDPEVLADLARGRLRAKLPALREALEGRFDRLHAVWVGAILAHLDFLDEQIASLTETIGEQIAPFEKAVELLCTIPGVQRRTAEVIIAEIGVDMSVFPTAKELASWAGQCPGNDQSAGRRRSGRTRKGSKWLDWALEEAALAATRTNDVYLQAQYQRLRPRRGHKKALGAVKHSIIIACWHMLSTGELYNDLGGDYFRKRDPQRTTKRLIAQLEALGHTSRCRKQSQPERYFPVRSSRRAGVSVANYGWGCTWMPMTGAAGHRSLPSWTV
jgi:transposase